MKEEFTAADMATAAAQGFRDGVASVANSAIPNNQGASAAPSQGQQVEFGDAYQGAREDLAIWKRRALEAEEKLRAQCDDQSFMGEPLVQPYEAPREKIEALLKQLGFNGQVSVGEILDAALTALKAQQVGQEPAVPECVERIRTLLPRFEAGVNWTGEDAAELAEAAYDAAELLTTKPAPDQDVAGEEVEVRGLQWLDTGHYRKKPPQFGYNPHDWNPLMTVAQHERIVAAFSAQQSKPSTVTRDQIRDVFMRNGFTVKEGQTDLKPYVYAAAQELLALVDTRQSAHVSVPRELLERTICRLTHGHEHDKAVRELRALLNGGEA